MSKDLPFYQHSGGGVTISGGEPLSQAEFTLQLLQALKQRGIHTALESTDSLPGIASRPCCLILTYFLFDLKHMDSAQHKTVVGIPNEIIHENARRIAQAGAKLQIRIPVIPLFNDAEDNIRKTGEFCNSLGDAVTMIQLLPYHNLGVMKYQRIDEDKVVLEAALPKDEEIQSLKAILERMGLNVTIH